MLIFTIACLIKELEWFFDRYDGNHENFLFRFLGLYISFDAEFNADSKYVNGFEIYFILKGLLGQKPCFWDSFLGFKGLMGEPISNGIKDSIFGISVKN